MRGMLWRDEKTYNKTTRLLLCDVIIQDERLDYQVGDLDVMVDGVFIEYQCYQGP